MALIFDIAFASWQGKRPYQEDSGRIFTPAQDRVAAIMSDGMGGQKGGAEASARVVDAFSACLHQQDCKEADLRAALARSVESMRELVSRDVAYQKMGATALAVCVTQHQLLWLSVGDSLLLHLRQGQVRRLNADHSCAPILDERARRGEISEAEALQDPTRSALRSVVKAEPPRLVDVRLKEDFLAAGDVLLVASDGLLSLSYEEIAVCLHDHNDAEALANVLCDAVQAKNFEGQDNTSVIVIKAE